MLRLNGSFWTASIHIQSDNDALDKEELAMNHRIWMVTAVNSNHDDAGNTLGGGKCQKSSRWRWRAITSRSNIYRRGYNGNAERKIHRRVRPRWTTIRKSFAEATMEILKGKSAAEASMETLNGKSAAEWGRFDENTERRYENPSPRLQCKR